MLFVRKICLLCIFCKSGVFAHDHRTTLIVDTDMGLDDVRTILLLLHSPDYRLGGVVITEGASDIDAGENNLKRLLAHFDASHIPVVPGVDLNLPVPPWREHSNAMGWVHERIEMPPAPTASPQATDLNGLIRELSADNPQFRKERAGIYYVSLGPMSTLARALEANPNLPDHISRVYFSGTGPDLAPSWNRKCDPDAYESVLGAAWEVVAFGRPDSELAAVSPEFIEKLSRLGSPAARFLAALHQAPHIEGLVQRGHLKFWDDPVALYLNYPALGTITKVPGRKQSYQLTDWDSEEAEARYLSLLSGVEPDAASRDF